MEREGPALEVLLQRIATTPEDFLLAPQSGKKAGKKSGVVVEAVVLDLLRDRGSVAGLLALEQQLRKANQAARSVALLLCWVLGDERMARSEFEAETVNCLFADGAPQLAEHTRAAAFVSDVERREELARFVLKRLGMRPLGESVAQADDRLTSLSAAERARVLEASRAAEARARAVREALARKAAEESADKWSRE
jgi:hypothetical protein